MRKIFATISVLVLGSGQIFAADISMPFNETFGNVTGSPEATTPLDMSKLDNPAGWTFTDAFAGPQCVIIKKGGTVTTPPIADLTGNATFYYEIDRWEDPTGKTELNPDDMKPHQLSLSKGTLAVSEYDGMSSGVATPYVIYDVDATSRLTLTASYDIRLFKVQIYYGSNDSGVIITEDYTKFSHESGDYFSPFDLTLTKTTSTVCYDDGQHNILVYTLDGSVPARTSRRYNGEAIHIASTTTVRTATIFGNGSMYADSPRTYNFPTAENPVVPTATYEVTVSKPGNLKAQLLDLDADVIEGLTLKGKINGADLNYLVSAEGRTATLKYLDLSEITFEYDNTAYRTVVDAPEGGMGTTYVYQYFLSDVNGDERVSASPTSATYNCYRNDLSAAFRKHSTIETVYLPKTITALGERMFEQCGELKYVGFPEGLTAVGEQAFYYCTNLKLYDFPTTFEKIGRGAFAGVKLGNVRLEKKTVIGPAAFTNTSMARLEVPFPTDTIPDDAFSYCSDLKTVIIGEGLKYLGKAFSYSKVEEMQLPSTLQEFGGDPFYACPFVEKIEPEGGIRYIGRVAYELADRDLTEYTVKAGTVSLSNGLFAFSSATKFNIPASVEIMGDEAFACTQITSMPEMPGLRRIGRYAFRDCQKLGRAVIPETVEYIDGWTFDNCNALWSLTYNAINANCPYGINARDIERIVIGDKVRRLPRGLYTNNTNVTELTLPQSLEILDENAFSGCSNLRFIRLSDNISIVSNYAFDGCTALADLHWPASLREIGDAAFRNCESLKVVSLPEGTEKVNYYAFGGCKNVEKLYIASTITELGSACFEFNSTEVPLTITATADEPLDYGWNWHAVGPATIKVPDQSIDRYMNNPVWNGSMNGKNNVIVTVSGISAPTESTVTEFRNAADTDLSDAVLGDVYVTIGEGDSYDATDGAIVLNSAMDAEYVEAVGGMAPGESDIANRFNGLVVQVPAGDGKVTVNCLTLGAKVVAVKIGETAPAYYTQSSKGDVTVPYNVTADTFVYIYASEASTPQGVRNLRTAALAENGSIRIYSVGVNPENLGVSDIEAEGSDSPIVGYYTIDGIKLSEPTAPGLYIVRRANGQVSKILMQ